jgi:hypothetical protein
VGDYICARDFSHLPEEAMALYLDGSEASIPVSAR